MPTVVSGSAETGPLDEPAGFSDATSLVNSEARYNPLASFDPYHRKPRRRCLVASSVALALLVILGSGLHAGEVGIVHASELLETAEHHCACGMNCGETCCCAPKPAEVPSPPAPKVARVETSAPRETPPCLGAKPCGGGFPIPEIGTIRVRIWASAGIDLLGGQSLAVDLLPPPGDDCRRACIVAQIDDPPDWMNAEIR